MNKMQFYAGLHVALVVSAGVVLLMALVGCTTPSGATNIQKVPVPIKCTAEVPQQPVLACRDTPVQPDGTFLDRFVANCTSDQELRDGYEGKLLAALMSCK